MKRNVIRKLLLVIGILLVFIGLVLLYFSFQKEVLDNNYIVEEFKGYKSKPNILEKGQLEIIQNIKYQGKGVFKVTFNNYVESKNNKNLLKENTNLTITDKISSDYVLLTEAIINGKKYNFNNNEIIDQNKINIKYDDYVIITIPHNLIKKENEISIFIKINNFDTEYRHYTNKDCYFTIEPDLNNDYYTKIGSQSYIIYGKGYLDIG